MIEPGGTGLFPSLSELRRHRDLAYLLSRREVASRYKQSAIGVFWAILQPLLLAAVFSVFLGLLAGVPSLPGIPQPVFIFSAMVLWLFVANGLVSSSFSTVANEDLISKIYFPRVLIPFANLFPALVDFVFAFLIVVGTMVGYGIAVQVQILLVPFLLLLAFVTVLGGGVLLSAVNVRYRDVHQVVPFLVLLGLFVSPVTYPPTLVPEHLQPLYALNPVVGLLELYRWMLFGTPVSGVVVLIGVAMSAAILVVGAAYFHRAESTFADVI